jgi:hypothetical protein
VLYVVAYRATITTPKYPPAVKITAISLCRDREGVSVMLVHKEL